VLRSKRNGASQRAQWLHEGESRAYIIALVERGGKGAQGGGLT